MSNTAPKKKTRNSSVELLRIIALLFIIFSHYCVHGGVAPGNLGFGLNQYLLQIFVLGNLGVVIFVLLSGYFLIESKFKVQRLLQLLLQVFFYSICIFLVFWGCGLEEFHVAKLIKAIFPTVFKQYWFFTAYVVLYLLFPYLNKLFHALNQKQHLIFLAVFLFVWSVIPSFTNVYKYNMYGSEIPQFILFYAIGAYLRTYPLNGKIEKKVGAVLTVFCTVFLWGSTLFFDWRGQTDSNDYKYITYCFERNSIFIILLGVGLFFILKNIKMKSNAFINGIASCVFGVYLFHENQYMRPFLWRELFQNSRFAESPYLILHMLGCVLSVFVLGTIIDWIRQKAIEKPILKLMNRVVPPISEKVKSVCLSINNRIFEKYSAT